MLHQNRKLISLKKVETLLYYIGTNDKEKIMKPFSVAKGQICGIYVLMGRGLFIGKEGV